MRWRMWIELGVKWQLDGDDDEPPKMHLDDATIVGGSLREPSTHRIGRDRDVTGSGWNSSPLL